MSHSIYSLLFLSEKLKFLNAVFKKNSCVMDFNLTLIISKEKTLMFMLCEIKK